MPLAPLLLVAAALQTPSYASTTSLKSATALASIRAVRAERAPVIDGRDDDDVWRTALAAEDFREFQPREDADPRFRTEVKVAYDAHHFYVFIRAYDPHPDSILTLLARRDVRPATDQLKIIVDSYHDRRTGYEFCVSPSGVKRDYAVFDDGNEDQAWDAVWEAGTKVDSLGWTAEFDIPLSQMRFAPGTTTFGFGVWRDIERYTERVSWPVYRRSTSGLSSQLGEVTGLEGLANPAKLELAPYTVAKSVPLGVHVQDGQVALGADLKYSLTSNLTLAATVNPDFGQVEADPAVLNLSAFETRFQERRPFFVEGTGIFQYDINCSVVSCSGENLFYSRRVGRSPTLGNDYGDARSPTATTIIGAGKLTGRLPSGLTVGALETVTAREVGTQNRTIEPATSWAALRAQQDLRKGQSTLGVMLTAVNRDLDQWTADVLRHTAYVSALDLRHRFAGGRYEVAGRFAWSRVTGSPAAIAGTQRSSVHNYQRPDGSQPLDTTRTSLTGDAEELFIRKVGGSLIRFESAYQRRSPGFEINDLGILFRADEQSWNTWGSLNFRKPTALFREAYWNFNWWQYWTADGLPTERAANTNLHVGLANHWWLHAGGTIGQIGDVVCPRCARGGPAVRVEPYVAPWFGIEGDGRMTVIPFFWFNYSRSDGGRSESIDLSPSVDLRVASRLTSSIGFNVNRNRDDWQFYSLTTDAAGAHYTFAHLTQLTRSFNLRLDYTISPVLSVQVYAAPFVTKGTFTRVRELSATPRAASYEDRYQPFGITNPGGFNVKDFRSNLVLRWEYRPGSTVFVVWSQGRHFEEEAAGDRSFKGDLDELFRMYPRNTFLVKLSYWINR
jgi:hypothetical protein